jgi:hypothetical protein
MLKCEKCGKSKVYLSSDGRNAWCQDGCGNYAHLEGELIFLGQFPGRPQTIVRPEGKLSLYRIRQQGNLTITEEEHLVELERALQEKVRLKKSKAEVLAKANFWWSTLTDEEKVQVYRCRYME